MSCTTRWACPGCVSGGWSPPFSAPLSTSFTGAAPPQGKHQPVRQSGPATQDYLYFSHLTSPYEEEEEEEFEDFDDMTLSHPGDRVGDAAEDDENVQTDWAKIYSMENRVDSEINPAPTNIAKRRNQIKKNKVSFLDNSNQSQTHTVFVELNPAALLLETKLDREVPEKEKVVEGGYEGKGWGGENDPPGKELSKDTDSEEFTVDNVKSKWSKL